MQKLLCLLQVLLKLLNVSYSKDFVSIAKAVAVDPLWGWGGCQIVWSLTKKLFYHIAGPSVYTLDGKNGSSIPYTE